MRLAEENELLKDDRFKNAKIFSLALYTSITISETGYIAIIDHLNNEKNIINIKDINSYELRVIENSVTSGLLDMLFGGETKKLVNSIVIIFKLNNFDKPIIEIPYIQSGINIKSKQYKEIQNEVDEIFGKLDYLKNNLSP